MKKTKVPDVLLLAKKEAQNGQFATPWDKGHWSNRK
jgi:hypothetical protein